MTKLKLNIFAFLILALLFTACDKYEEGSNFSLISAKKRIEGKWELTKYTLNGNDWSQDMVDNSYNFKKDGTFTATAFYVFANQTFNLGGTWELTNDKKGLNLYYGSSTDPD